MKKTVTALVAIAATAGSLVTVTPQAKAHDGVGAGIAAGLLGGAIVGGAIAASRPVYVAPAPVYVEAAPCYWQHQRYWDGYGWVIRPVRVCY
jgi:hypothetical protein